MGLPSDAREKWRSAPERTPGRQLNEPGHVPVRVQAFDPGGALPLKDVARIRRDSGAKPSTFRDNAMRTGENGAAR